MTDSTHPARQPEAWMLEAAERAVRRVIAAEIQQATMGRRGGNLVDDVAAIIAKHAPAALGGGEAVALLVALDRLTLPECVVPHAKCDEALGIRRAEQACEYCAVRWARKALAAALRAEKETGR